MQLKPVECEGFPSSVAFETLSVLRIVILVSGRGSNLEALIRARDGGTLGVEIAAESTTASPVKYQDVIRAMDVALKVGFLDVGLSDPAGLAARPSL